MLTGQQIEAMTTEELNQYARKENACAAFMNSLLPSGVQPSTVASTIRKAFHSGWEQRKIAEYEAMAENGVEPAPNLAYVTALEEFIVENTFGSTTDEIYSSNKDDEVLDDPTGLILTLIKKKGCSYAQS